MSSRRRSNSLISLQIDRVLVERMAKVRYIVYQDIKNHSWRTPQLRPDTGGLVFKS